MSMRPSGRNAIRQGRLNVVTCVIVNGWFGSSLCSPALTCAPAADGTSVRSSAALISVLMCLVSFTDQVRVQRIRERANHILFFEELGQSRPSRLFVVS